MPKQKNRPKNKPKPEIGEIEDKPKRHGPRWLMGKNDKFGMNDLFRLYQQYGGMQQEDQGEGNTIYEDDVNYYGPPPGTPGAGTYIGDQSGISGMAGMPAVPASPQTPAQPAYAQQAGQLGDDPWNDFWGQQAQRQPQPGFGNAGAADMLSAAGALGSDVPGQPGWVMGPDGAPEKASIPGTAGNPVSGYNGAPEDQVALAQKYGAEYGVDPGVLLAIAKHETGYGELGLGRKGLHLGYGAYDSGETMKWAGADNQYRAGAERLQDWGVKGLQDIISGKAASWATDPNWEKGIQGAYESLGGQLEGAGAEAGASAHIGGTPLTNYGKVQVGQPVADTLMEAEAMFGRPISITDGYRSHDQQADVYKRKPGLAVAPGKSYHERGLAIDVDTNQFTPEEFKKFVSHMKSKGYAWGGDFKNKKEPWHFGLAENGAAPATPAPTTPAPTDEEEDDD